MKDWYELTMYLLEKSPEESDKKAEECGLVGKYKRGELESLLTGTAACALQLKMKELNTQEGHKWVNAA